MRAIALILSVVLLSQAARAEDWRQFRGNHSSGVSEETNLPTKLDDPEAIRWKAELPGRGLSGPVIVGERVFLTASSGYRDDQLHILCFSTTTGKQLWDRRFKATGRTVCHESMCMATPQACSDGERIYAYYSCNASRTDNSSQDFTIDFSKQSKERKSSGCVFCCLFCECPITRHIARYAFCSLSR